MKKNPSKTNSAAKTPKSTKTSRSTQSVRPTKTTPPVATTHNTTPETPAWVTALAIFLIILGYAVYRLWGVAKVDNTTISRLAYYRAMEQRVGDQVLDDLITEALIAKAGKDNNVVIDQKTIDDEIATESARIEAQGLTVEQALAAARMTMSDVRRQYALRQIVAALGMGDTSVSAQEIDDYIAQNKTNLPELNTAELRSVVEQQLQNQKANDNIAKWLSDLKAKADIIKY